MLPLLDGVSQTLATETDLRLFSDEQANQVIKSAYPLWLNYVNRLTTNYFVPIIYNPIHPLHRLLTPKSSKPYFTSARVHNYVLPSKTTTLDECNFMCRILYEDCF